MSLFRVCKMKYTFPYAGSMYVCVVEINMQAGGCIGFL